MNACTLLPPTVNVCVHGTYRSGRWTRRPNKVVLFVGDGIDTAGRVGTTGKGGKRVSSVAVTSMVTDS